MTVIPDITNSAITGVGSQKPLFQIAGNQQWLDTLTAGQILKGRIMRHFGEGRYGVNFSGQERVVDSAIPLSVGEILTGKIVGLAEHSVHMHIIPTAKAPLHEVSPLGLEWAKQNSSLGNIKVLAEQLGLQLDQLQLNAIAQGSKGLGAPELAMKIGFFVAKHGLPVSPELIRAVYARIDEPSKFISEDGFLPDIDHLVATNSLEQAPVVKLLQQYLIEYDKPQYLNEEGQKHLGVQAVLPSAPWKAEAVSQETQQYSDKEERNRSDLWNLCFAILLNAQTGAVYQHQFKSLPIVVNDRLVEFDLALFDHGKKEFLEGEVQSRHLKFSLMTNFGLVSLNATILNNRVHLQVMCESQWLMKELALYQLDLTNHLQEAGWRLDRVEYELGDKVITPAEAVIHHVLEQDSLNVFM